MASEPAPGKLKHRLFTAGSAILGGGIAYATSAAMDPEKYHFPRDFGSGKLWKYFLMGALLTLGGLVLHSPLGHKVMAGWRQHQAHTDECELEAPQKEAR